MAAGTVEVEARSHATGMGSAEGTRGSGRVPGGASLCGAVPGLVARPGALPTAVQVFCCQLPSVPDHGQRWGITMHHNRLQRMTMDDMEHVGHGCTVLCVLRALLSL